MVLQSCLEGFLIVVTCIQEAIHLLYCCYELGSLFLPSKWLARMENQFMAQISSTFASEENLSQLYLNVNKTNFYLKYLKAFQIWSLRDNKFEVEETHLNAQSVRPRSLYTWITCSAY